MRRLLAALLLLPGLAFAQPVTPGVLPSNPAVSSTIWVDASCPAGTALDPTGSTDTTACWTAAIAANAARGGGRISVRANSGTAGNPATYKITSALGDPGSYATIDVPRGTRLAVTSTATSLAVIQVYGNTYGGSYALAATTVPGAATVTLDNTPTFPVGAFVAIRVTQVAAPSNVFWHVAPVTAISGSVITLAANLPPGFLYTQGSDSSSVVPFLPRRGLRISGLELDGTNVVPSTYSGASIIGLRVNYCVDCEIDVSIRNFSAPRSDNNQVGNVAGFYADVGFNNRFRVTTDNSGSAGLSDQEVNAQTAGEWSALSRNASGFGPKLKYSTYMSVPSVTSTGAFDRAFKTQGVLASNFGGVMAVGGGDTGCSITLGSSYNNFGMMQCIGNGQNAYSWPSTNRVGIWFSDQNNSYNNIATLVSYGNSSSDLQVYTSDVGNTIGAAVLGSLTGLVNTGNATIRSLRVPGGVAYDGYGSQTINGGVMLSTATAKPTCDATKRGMFWAVQAASGTKDDVQVCAKDAANAYAWRTIY